METPMEITRSEVESLPTNDAPDGETPVSISSDPENFNEPSTRRIAVLQEMGRVLNGREVPVPFWAFCQVADIEILGIIVNEFAALSRAFTEVILQNCFAVPWIWAHNRLPELWKELNPPSATTSSTSSDRRRTLDTLVRERDKDVCVLSQNGLCDVAHIFPYHLFKPSTVPSIWSPLTTFWPAEKIERWKSVVFPNETTAVNSISNLICMRNDLQRAWTQGRFALRPVSLSDDKKELCLEFHWMRRPGHAWESTIPITQRPLSTRNADCADECFIVRQSMERVVSGTIIKLTTADPERLPLPSYDLMEMVWYLARVVSMSAAAYPWDVDRRFERRNDDVGPFLRSEDILDWIPDPRDSLSPASSPRPFDSEDRSPVTSHAIN